MKEILIFRHAAGEGPGYFARFLDRHGLRYRVIRIDQNEPVPDSIGDSAALVLMGGPMSVNDALPWIPKVLRLIGETMDADRPLLGHCLGGQLLSKALGGTVTSNKVREIGWFPVRRTENTAANDWLDRLPPEFETFHWHGETFTIPPGGSHILSSDACPNQGFVVGKALGLQCHVEMLTQMVHDWSRIGREEIAWPSETVQSAGQMAEALEDRIERLHRVADVLYDRWIRGLS
ncbi:MAG: type 1 glutamine amidotransferase [Acidiferrobacterales bacterium]